MKKLESTWYNMAVVLTLIAIVAGAALAYVNELTKETIAEINQKNEDQAKKDVLRVDEISIIDEKTIEVEGAQYVVYNAGEAGLAIKAVDPKNASFGGGLTIMVGFDTEGTILGYKVLASQETPGLGAKAAEWFQSGGKGCIIGLSPKNGALTVSKDGGQVDAITASTITSRAFLRAVNAAYNAYSQTIGAQQVDSQSGASVQYN